MSLIHKTSKELNETSYKKNKLIGIILMKKYQNRETKNSQYKNNYSPNILDNSTLILLTEKCQIESIMKAPYIQSMQKYY
ncbi:unnamed protein product [Paramecium pentaurelia]|uniref:Uncharacterized protein n=1 Tax=Paramecium pentaurelia TaxID=43138 RepID=A0A8S1TD13_9CILI|nr:unnamed protein product [Paramecium pentaurelia]